DLKRDVRAVLNVGARGGVKENGYEYRGESCGNRAGSAGCRDQGERVDDAGVCRARGAGRAARAGAVGDVERVRGRAAAAAADGGTLSAVADRMSAGASGGWRRRRNGDIRGYVGRCG